MADAKKNERRKSASPQCSNALTFSSSSVRTASSPAMMMALGVVGVGVGRRRVSGPAN